MASADNLMKNVVDIGGSILKGIANGENWTKVGGMLTSNKSIIDNVTEDAINKSQGMAGTVLRMMGNEGLGVKPQNFSEAIKNAYTNNGVGINAGAIAGSYIGAAAGYRVLSGGGLYRDKNGNANIIGIPFV